MYKLNKLIIFVENNGNLKELNVVLSQEFLQELKYRSDITSVVSRYVNLRKSGRCYVGLCPFHSEKTPSFNVYADTQNFYCFGCGAGGDVITFIRLIENLDYLDTVKLLAQQCGLELPEDDIGGGSDIIRRKVLEINREAAKFFHSCLKTQDGAPGVEYLKKRGLSSATVTHFGLGFAPNRWDSLLNHLRALGYTEQEMVTAALIRSKDDRYFDLFRNRVMFPIIDVQGNVIAFGGRVLDDSKPKYLNSPDTPVFKKSRGLYALNFAKNGNNNNLILCEGYMDVIAMHQAGFKNAVATLGTALTPEQSRLMARYAKDVVVSYDSDEAGRKAAQRAIGLLTQAGIGVRVLNIEGGKDPDEFIKTHGADKFKLMLEKSGSHIEYRLTAAKAKYDLSKPDQKVEFLKEAANVLATVESLIEREVYAGRLSQELEISKDNLLSEVNRIVARGSSKKLRDGIRTELDASRGLKDRLNPLKVKYLKAAMAEESLIVLLYKNPDFLKTLDTLISPEDFMTEFNRRVYETERNLVLSGGEADLTAIGEQFTPEETGKITGMLMLRKVSNTIEEARDCAKVILEEKMLKSDNGIDALDKLEELRQKKLDKNTGGNYK